MNEWKRTRQAEISEHILVTHIICFIVFFMTVISLYGTYVPNLSSNFFNILAVTIPALTIILYIANRLVSGITMAQRPSIPDLSLFIFTLVLSIIIVSLTGQSDSPVKIILLIPIIIFSTSYGKTFGIITAGLSCLVLFYFHFTSGLDSTPSIKFQTDIINSAVMLTLAWLIGGLADIEKGVREQLTHLANTDELTGLSNHRHFQESLRLCQETARKNNSPFSLIMFDIDYFKFYNDNFGHQKGDEVLKKIGSILKSVVQRPNCVARYGGEEFTVIVPGPETKALEIAEMIRTQIEAFPFEGAEIQPNGKITVSLGVASYPKHGSTPKEIIRFADEALYKAKYSRNKVQLYFSVIDDLREGITETEIDLFNSMKTLISIINAKDRYTFGHSERVVYYSVKLAEQLGFSKEELVLLRYGSFLHDIGKIEINRELLNKVGPLKPKELSILKKHPVWGSDIVRPISSLRQAIPTILCHHENFDGSGYPSGLSGDEIPLQARILRITDSFDAMTTDRPYKKANSIDEACKELERCSGTLFDPFLVDKFIQCILKDNTKSLLFADKSII